MASVTSPPDKVVILVLLDDVLGWDLDSGDLPDVGTSLSLVEKFTAYGQVLVDDLRRTTTAPGVLGEADRRLTAPPPAATPRAAASRAQNLARLIQALHRVTEQVQAEHVRTARRQPQQTTRKGAS